MTPRPAGRDVFISLISQLLQDLERWLRAPRKACDKAGVIGYFKKIMGAGKGAKMAPKSLDRSYWIF